MSYPGYSSIFKQNTDVMEISKTEQIGVGLTRDNQYIM